MKKLLKKRFLGIPMAAIAIVLVAAVVAAGVGILLSSTQTITQEIEAPYVPPPTYALTMVADPDEGGTVYSSPSGSNEAGTSMTIQAVAAADWEFISWTSIPEGIIANADASLAHFLMPSSDVTFTAYFAEVIPPDYGSITSSPIVLPPMLVGETYGSANVGTVVVEVGPDGVDKCLYMRLDKDSADLYAKYSVTIGAMTSPMGGPLSLLVQFGTMLPETLEASLQLTEPGTYTFTEYVWAVAGSTPGSASVTVIYTLEDCPAP